MSKINSRTKGHSFEREIAQRLKPIFPFVKRLLEYQEGFGFDLTGTGWFHIQCKRYKKSVPMSKINEIPLSDKFMPVLISKCDREPIYVTMKFDDWLSLVTFYLIGVNSGDSPKKET